MTERNVSSVPPTLEEVVCWVNAWADEPKWTVNFNRDYHQGYEDATYAIYRALADVVPAERWLPTWRSRSWERLRGRYARANS